MTTYIARFTANLCNLFSNLCRNPFVIPCESTGKLYIPDYRFESERLKSFKNWPCAWMKPEKLAAAGFYYTGRSDIVKCFACQIEIHTWQPDDDPMLDHRRWSERCRFVCNIPRGDVPIGPDPEKVSSFAGYDECGAYDETYMMTYMKTYMKYLQLRREAFEDTYGVKDSEIISPNLATILPMYPEFVNYDARLRTYDTWPKAMSQTKEELAAAGLFYVGNDDQTLCYHCGGGLREWDPEDDPWEQHVRWFRYCPYLQMVKGTDYINRITCAGIAEQSTIVKDQVDEKGIRSSAGSKGAVEKQFAVQASDNGSIYQWAPLRSLCKKLYNKVKSRSKKLPIAVMPCEHSLTCTKCRKNMRR
ncbi:unnamed protein product [Lasius platythorax]|uniref:Apoptosis 1 inhibitor n=1 Tax=Lasius platythorax TaxID=488582 RepID=A0AAV2P7L2_9HYME